MKLKNVKKEIFHLRHELYTQLAYRIPWLPPHRFVFILTNQCNLDCRDCYQQKNYKKEMLGKDDWMDLSDRLPGFCRITITGGEPFLAKNFNEIFRSIASRHQCNIITNGTLLTQELIKLLLSFPKFRVLAVSLDGFKESTMRLRRMSLEEWDKLERMLKSFIHMRNEAASGCSLEIKTLILDENADTLFDFHRYCMESLGADQHTFQFLKGSPLQHSDTSYPFDHVFNDFSAPTYKNFKVIVEQLDKIRQYNIRNSKTAYLHPIMADLNTKLPLEDISLLNKNGFQKYFFAACKFPWSSLHVNYDGEIFPCLSISLGNIKQNSVTEILKGEPYRRFLSVIKKHGLVSACNRCGWLRRSA